jgi:acyl carrier protein
MEKLLKILKRVKPEVDFIENNNLIDKGILDSIDIVTIISEIEMEYLIEFDPEEIDPDNFQSVLTMLEMIEKTKKMNEKR